jgi:hypothetical protein
VASVTTPGGTTGTDKGPTGGGDVGALASKLIQSERRHEAFPKTSSARLFAYKLDARQRSSSALAVGWRQ